MHPSPCFSTELVDGCCLGRLHVPFSEIADWLNFLIMPHYQVDILAVEQAVDHISISFQANEGVYLYLERFLNASSDMALAS
ncbi:MULTISPECIES: hypothetical protein [unclassified Leptolyngbya]|uniref:hypothetical protein n=1 Tax=unclassified Leptolyngbya TaxID=2650499 RepID=UPI001685B957|nr:MULTISPECIES: hypothetical protein [unclassified Leptolyngbya]MBD1909302.1 hypothetical protein [Leptolyngbya sp. FACHB-8]MBD2153532.1 hypothetical protein [Leptolyngbya sp. FACHB-16]